MGEHQLVGGDHVFARLQGLYREGMGGFHAADQLDDRVDLRIVQYLIIVGGLQVLQPRMPQQFEDANDVDVVAPEQVLVNAGADRSEAQQSDIQKQQPLCVFRANTRVFMLETL